MVTLALAVGITLTYACALFGEWMGDKPMPDDMKIWFMSGIVFSWVMFAVVSDLKDRVK